MHMKTKQFIKTHHIDPHKQRRKALLATYPYIQTLIGHDKKTKYIAIALVFLQWVIAYYALHLPGCWWFITIYCVGATINHILFTVIHELSHCLAFKSRFANRCFAIFVNLPLGIPAAAGFEKYHLMHHRYMGDIEKDVDIPLIAEAHLFTSNIGKWVWLLLQPFTYTLRPLIKYPQKLTPWEWTNIVIQLLFDGLSIYLFGGMYLAFLVLSTFFGMSLHPLALHFIAEHYIIDEDQETYSYYGPLNNLTFNVGFHVEHHDFPGIPWSRIKQLKKIAPEFYNSLYSHPSWIGFMWTFVRTKNITLFSRVIRNQAPLATPSPLDEVNQGAPL